MKLFKSSIIDVKNDKMNIDKQDQSMFALREKCLKGVCVPFIMMYESLTIQFLK